MDSGTELSLSKLGNGFFLFSDPSSLSSSESDDSSKSVLPLRVRCFDPFLMISFDPSEDEVDVSELASSVACFDFPTDLDNLKREGNTRLLEAGTLEGGFRGFCHERLLVLAIRRLKKLII